MSGRREGRLLDELRMFFEQALKGRERTNVVLQFLQRFEFVYDLLSE